MNKFFQKEHNQKLLQQFVRQSYNLAKFYNLLYNKFVIIQISYYNYHI